MSVQRFAILRGFLSEGEQVELAENLLPNARQEEVREGLSMGSKASIGLDLGLEYHMGPWKNELVVALARRAFARAVKKFEMKEMGMELSRQARMLEERELTGIALVYGPLARMVAHHDSASRPGQRHEWLAMITLGNAVRFRLGDEARVLFSGDALVMDAMATLHGVDGVLSPEEAEAVRIRGGNECAGDGWGGDGLTEREVAVRTETAASAAAVSAAEVASDPAVLLGLPPRSRLGALLWGAAPRPAQHATASSSSSSSSTVAAVGGVAGMFSRADEELGVGGLFDTGDDTDTDTDDDDDDDKDEDEE